MASVQVSTRLSPHPLHSGGARFLCRSWRGPVLRPRML